MSAMIGGRDTGARQLDVRWAIAYDEKMFEGVDPALLGTVRALARELRYRERTPLVGRTVWLESAACIDQAVRAAVPELGADAVLAPDDSTTRALGALGILDLAYRLATLDAPAAGLRTLRALGFLERLDDPEAREVAELLGDSRFLGDMLGECREGKGWLRLFVVGPRPADVVPDWMKRGGWCGRLLEGYLPRRLSIIDACETNYRGVWLEKHFYL